MKDEIPKVLLYILYIFPNKITDTLRRRSFILISYNYLYCLLYDLHYLCYILILLTKHYLLGSYAKDRIHHFPKLLLNVSV